MAPRDPLLADVLATISQSAQTGKRSALYRWMLAHHRQLEATMQSGIGTEGWERLVKRFTDAGLTNRNGGPLTVHSVRKTWWTVRADVRKAGQQAAPAPIPPSPAVRPLARDARSAPPPTTKPTTPEGQNARSAPAGRTGFRHDPIAREGDAEELLGSINKPDSK
jgi:hypothetical protein